MTTYPTFIGGPLDGRKDFPIPFAGAFGYVDGDIKGTYEPAADGYHWDNDGPIERDGHIIPIFQVTS